MSDDYWSTRLIVQLRDALRRVESGEAQGCVLVYVGAPGQIGAVGACVDKGDARQRMLVKLKEVVAALESGVAIPPPTEAAEQERDGDLHH